MHKSYPQRKSPRLQGYDYSLSGAYFVTSCTHQRIHHFGEIHGEEMQLTDIGNLTIQCWLALPQHFPRVELDLWVVMPNHVHGIILLDDQVKTIEGNGRAVARPYKVTLGMVVNAFKGAVTRSIRRDLGYDDFLLWQARYHDHIIRDEASLNYIRHYVLNNPAKWSEDTFYDRTKTDTQ